MENRSDREQFEDRTSWWSLLVRPTAVGAHLRAGIVTVTFVLVLVGFLVGSMSYGFDMENRGRWDLISERTVPAAWSATLFLLAAALMFGAARREHVARRPEWRWWTALGLVAVAAAVDEFFSFHERTMEPIREALGVGGLLLYAWVIPGIVLLLVLAVTFAGFVKRLDAPVRTLLVRGAAALVAGGVGMEMIGGWWAQEIGINYGWMVVFTLEESLEFLGAVLIVFAMLRHHEAAGSRLLTGPLVSRAARRHPGGPGSQASAGRAPTH